MVDSGGATLAGRASHSDISRNEAIAESAGGNATASSGGALAFGVLGVSTVVGNELTATAPNGRATAGGAGLSVDFRPLRLFKTEVAENVVTATGQSGWARGGGIFNGELFSTGAPLKLVKGVVHDNTAVGVPPIKLRGGGVYSPRRQVTIDGTTLAGNAPDDCAGC